MAATQGNLCELQSMLSYEKVERRYADIERWKKNVVLRDMTAAT